MRTLTVRLPENLAAEIEAESRARSVAKSDVVRERLQYRHAAARRPLTMAEAAADILRQIDEEAIKTAHLPRRSISANKKKFLREWGYGKNRSC